MTDWDMKAEDYQQIFTDWYSDNEIGEFIEYTEENWEKVQKMDTHYIWTNHSTCEDEMTTAGAHYFKNNCCWDTFGWWVAKKPWRGDSEGNYESYNVSAYLPCESCNPDGEGDEEAFNENCDDCEGTGFVHHYFD